MGDTLRQRAAAAYTAGLEEQEAANRAYEIEQEERLLARLKQLVARLGVGVEVTANPMDVEGLRFYLSGYGSTFDRYLWVGVIAQCGHPYMSMKPSGIASLAELFEHVDSPSAKCWDCAQNEREAAREAEVDRKIAAGEPLIEYQKIDTVEDRVLDVLREFIRQEIHVVAELEKSHE